jgi:hypothetical protein
MKLEDIGRCWSCTRKVCPTPKAKKQRPELGCPLWKRDRKVTQGHKVRAR